MRELYRHSIDEVDGNANIEGLLINQERFKIGKKLNSGCQG
jgi:hypothetical protein